MQDAGGRRFVSVQLNGVSVNGPPNTPARTSPAGGVIISANLSSSNAHSGIVLNDNAAGDRIEGNRIGTNAAGSGAVPNADGVGRQHALGQRLRRRLHLRASELGLEQRHRAQPIPEQRLRHPAVQRRQQRRIRDAPGRNRFGQNGIANVREFTGAVPSGGSSSPTTPSKGRKRLRRAAVHPTRLHRPRTRHPQAVSLDRSAGGAAPGGGRRLRDPASMPGPAPAAPRLQVRPGATAPGGPLTHRNRVNRKPVPRPAQT
jgi:hypothetical protein